MFGFIKETKKKVRKVKKAVNKTKKAVKTTTRFAKALNESIREEGAYQKNRIKKATSGAKRITKKLRGGI